MLAQRKTLQLTL